MNSENFILIHVLNRAQLINDAFNLARLKEIPWDIPLRLGEYIIREEDYIPLAAFYDAVSSNTFVYPFSDRKSRDSEYFRNYTLPNAISSEDPSEYYIYKVIMLLKQYSYLINIIILISGIFESCIKRCT